MKIKHLLEIYNQAPDKEREVFIPLHENGEELTTSKIGFNFDDNNDLEFYPVYTDDHYFNTENKTLSNAKRLNELTFQLTQEFTQLRNDDEDFANQYRANEINEWIKDFNLLANQ